MLWLRYAALPHIDRYRDEIFSSIEKASGMAVSARHIHGGWEGLRPHVYLDGFRISDRGGKLALGLERAEASLSWWALLVGQVRFHDVDFHRPELVLRRGADGLIYLADKPLNGAGPADDTFSEWLLSQPRVGIHDAVLVWRDESIGAQEVRLTDVQIAVRKHLGGHRIAFTAAPPRELAARIEARADLDLRKDAGRWQASGELFAQALDADLGRLRAHLPVPETLRSGAGSVRVWATLAPQGVTEIVADLDMRDARAQFASDAGASDAMPLELASLAGRAIYRAQPDGFSLSTQGLRLRLHQGAEAHPGNFSLSRTAPQGRGEPPRVEVRADGIDVKLAATLLEYFPVPREMKAQLLRFAPRGRITEAALSWTGEDASQAKTYSLKGRFEDLAVNAVDAFPGVTGLSGRIEGTQAGGTLRLDSKNLSFELERFFRAPLRFDRVDARASWKHTGRALEVAIEDLRFSNPDTAGAMAGTWRSLPDAKEKSPGFVNLTGHLDRADPSRIAAYMPNRLATTRDWLERSLQSGSTAHVKFEVKGDLYEFPFGEGHAGHFLVEGALRDARLRYHPEWPAIDAIQGSFRFENRRMEIRAERASIFASRAAPITAVIDDFAMKPPLLRIEGVVDTTAADTFRFLRESPLVNGPGAFTRAVAVEGPGSLKLRLEYPLWGTDPIRVAGDYQFNGATASVGRNLAMRDVRGRLAFTEKGVRGQDIRGTLFNQPASLSIASQPDAQVLTTLEGRIEAAALGAYAPAFLAAKMDGATAWRARILSGRQGSELTIDSDLAGLGVALPEPLAKAASAPRPLTVSIARLGADNEVTTVALAGGVFGRFARAAGSERWQGALRFGAPVANEPLREGLWLYGSLAALDVDAWQSLLAAPRAAASAPAPSAPPLELRGVDLQLARARYMGRDFAQMHARLERDEGQWSGTLESPRVAGDVHWNPQGKGRLVAKLERLTLIEAQPDAAQPPRQDEPADLPALDVAAEHFEFRGRWLGRLDLKAEPAGDEWRIDRLDLTNGHAQFKSSGGWRRTATGSLTTLALKLDAENLNALMAQFGFGDYLKRGNGSLEGQLAWSGYPYEFALAALAGNLKVDARRGQFAKIDTGAGKLLGLLSLQSLPRRAMFDFRDVFNEGFAFERIQGDVKVARGVLLVEGFEISGPAAFVSLTGEVSLPQETQALTMQVVPEVSEGLALAATVFGTPVLGLSTLLLSKLLKNPFGKAVAYEYQVTGSWDNPTITRLSAPPARALSSMPQGAATAAKASTSP